MTDRELFSLAVAVKVRSYSPYSGFAVGAALLCADGTVYTGSNIENASYTPTVCAERVAFFKAVSEGKRDFTAIAVAGGESDTTCPPCGVCRQVMAEFCTADFAVVISDGNGGTQRYTLAQLLPFRFPADNL